MDSRKNKRIIITPKDGYRVPEKKPQSRELVSSLSKKLNGWPSKTKKTALITAVSISIVFVITFPILQKEDKSEVAIANRQEAPAITKPSETLLEKIESDKFKKDPYILRENQLFTDIAGWKNTNLQGEVTTKILEVLRNNGFEYLPKGCGVNFYYSRLNNSLEFISIEPELGKYAVVRLYPYVHLENLSKKIEILTVEKSAIVGEVGSKVFSENRLYLALEENQIPSQIIPYMEKALSWSVDLHHLNIGDKFKVIYDVKAIDGEPTEITKLKAIYLDNGEKELYGFFVDQLDTSAFFDEKGRSLKKKFLMSPIKYAYISSPFSENRLHPVLGINKPHYGTDFAALEGTPVFSVGDGKVTKVASEANNGNFVKIKHDNIYETQYLHLQGFAPSISVGKSVRQGEVIGYVGKTGLATGPHLCFRFWKDNKQVDPRKENAVGQPGNSKLDIDQLQVFISNRDPLMRRLQQMDYQ